jgi:hypothetical protein
MELDKAGEREVRFGIPRRQWWLMKDIGEKSHLDSIGVPVTVKQEHANLSIVRYASIKKRIINTLPASQVLPIS